MTKDEIVKMQPGRELDIQVALTVMDYIWLKHLLQFSAELAVKWLGTKADIEKSGGVYVVVPESQFVSLKERENYAEAVLPFSTTIEAAEQVVSQMEKLGYQYTLQTKEEDEKTQYHASFHNAEGLAGTVGCTSLSAAIVKAALFAVLQMTSK